MEGDLLYWYANIITHLFQSTPSAWRETQDKYGNYCIIFISIHSLRMEGDRYLLPLWVFLCGISIHSLRMEGDYS